MTQAPPAIENSRRAYEIFRSHLTADVEEIWALALNSGKMPIRLKRIFRGTVDACLAHPRDIFRFACVSNSSNLIIAHNHPSHDPMPSPEDIAFTRKLITGGFILEIPVLDHLIIAGNRYLSLADQRLCNFSVFDGRDQK